MKTIYSFLIGFVSLTVASCDILEPMNDTHDTEDRLTENIYAEGILFNGYTDAAHRQAVEFQRCGDR